MLFQCLCPFLRTRSPGLMPTCIHAFEHTNDTFQNIAMGQTSILIFEYRGRLKTKRRAANMDSHHLLLSTHLHIRLLRVARYVDYAQGALYIG